MIVAGLVGVAGNELVAAYRVRVGRRIGSAALVADGIHARTDGLTSAAVVIGAVLVLAGYPRADPIVGLLITAAIAVVAVGAARAVLGRLMDSVDPHLVDQVEATLRACPGIDGVDSVRIRWVGHELRAEIRVVSDAGLSLVDAHAIAEAAHHRLLHEVPRLAEAVIHTSPSGHDAVGPHDEIAHHFPAAPGRRRRPGLRPEGNGRVAVHVHLHHPIRDEWHRRAARRQGPHRHGGGADDGGMPRRRRRGRAGRLRRGLPGRGPCRRAPGSSDGPTCTSSPSA